MNRKAIYDYYYWRYQMGASALPGEKEMKLAPLEVFQDCRNGCPDMVVIPAGTFMMGSDEGGNSEFLATPRHPVEFKRPFAISKTEVTFKQWQLCVDSGACNNIMDDSGWGRGDRPVINVEWEECRQYAAWLSRLSRKKYRLPSEAEWEYAARAGTKTRFFFGDDESALDQYAWFKSNSDGMTHPAGMKKPNAFGLLDIYGNVREWVADYAHKTYDGAPGDGTAWGETSDVDKSRRIVRGRSWDSGPEELGSANRDGGTLRKGYKIVGFRLARDLDR